ncbi:unnamed protein product [Ophioblennius macclurei]
MSSKYSAGQYDSAFRAHRMQNWCQAKPCTKRPAANHGHTTIISNDRGHLLPEIKQRGSAWPDFKGTWDLPNRIPAHHINPTSRSQAGLRRLRAWGFEPERVGSCQPHRGSKSTECLQVAAEQSSEGPASRRSVCENEGVLSSRRDTPSVCPATDPDVPDRQQSHRSAGLQSGAQTPSRPASRV